MFGLPPEMKGHPLYRPTAKILGLWALIRLAFALKFRFGSRYWKWRMETAFGKHKMPGREKRKAAIEYGQWVHQMKKLERQRRRA